MTRRPPFPVMSSFSCQDSFSLNWWNVLFTTFQSYMLNNHFSQTFWNNCTFTLEVPMSDVKIEFLQEIYYAYHFKNISVCFTLYIKTSASCLWSRNRARHSWNNVAWMNAGKLQHSYTYTDNKNFHTTKYKYSVFWLLLYEGFALWTVRARSSGGPAGQLPTSKKR
jgi:hypothetical protein